LSRQLVVALSPYEGLRHWNDKCLFAGPDLPQVTYGAAMVPTPDGTGVVLIALKDLYELKCLKDQNAYDL
jgi:hypothetical protein